MLRRALSLPQLPARFRGRWTWGHSRLHRLTLPLCSDFQGCLDVECDAATVETLGDGVEVMPEHGETPENFAGCRDELFRVLQVPVGAERAAEGVNDHLSRRGDIPIQLLAVDDDCGLVDRIVPL